MIGVKLLDLALDSCLRRVFDEDVGPVQDRGGQFGLSGAISADRVDVYARANHVVRQDRRILLVGSTGRQDLRTLYGLFGAVTRDHVQRGPGEVVFELPDRVRVDIPEPHGVDADHGLHRAALELRLSPVADHRHRLGTLGCQHPRRQRRHRRRAHRRQHRHLTQQNRIARGDVSQQAKGGDGLQPLFGILGMAVDVFETINLTIRGRHQLDHPFRRMGCDAGGFVEKLPPAKVGLDVVGQTLQHRVDPDVMDQLHHVIHRNEGDERLIAGFHHV